MIHILHFCFSLPPSLFLLHLLCHPPSFSLPLPPLSFSLLRIPSSNIHSSLVFTHNENTIAKDQNQTSSNDRAVLRPFMPAQVSAIQRRVCELMNSIYCPLSPLQPPHCTISFISHVGCDIIIMRLCNVYSSSNYRCVCVSI